MVEQLENVVNSIVGGQFGVVVVINTIPTWKSVHNPYVNRVRKITKISNCGFGVRYENVVESHATQCGIDTTETPFVVEKRKGMHPKYDNNCKIFVSDKDENQHYLSLVFRGNESKDVQYTLDGVLVEDPMLRKDIESYIRPPYISKKQIAYGVSKDKVVKTISPKFENIVYLGQGNKVYRREDNIIIKAVI